MGVWSFALQTLDASAARAALNEYEDAGVRATWIPESIGSKDVFAHAAILLAASRRMVLATGIANIYARDPMAMANGARALADAFPGRFVLGIGVSHAPSVAQRGSTYGKPVETMRAYLDAMAAADYAAPAPAEPAPLLLAALGPRMLELAAERTDGAHPYFVPVEHTAMARERLGPAAFLAVEQTAVIDLDPTRGREVAHEFARRYLGLAELRQQPPPPRLVRRGRRGLMAATASSTPSSLAAPSRTSSRAFGSTSRPAPTTSASSCGPAIRETRVATGIGSCSRRSSTWTSRPPKPAWPQSGSAAPDPDSLRKR